MPRPANPLFSKDFKLMTQDELWQHYEACLKAHDWQHEYSDDYQVWSLGFDESTYIDNLGERLHRIDRKRTLSLYESKGR